jgi:hypothetical protein
MHQVCLASAFILAFAAAACSDDDTGNGAVSTTNPNQPAGGGSAGSAGSAGVGSGGTSAAAMAGSGGASAEGPDDDIDLDDSSGDDDEGSSGSAGADASAPPADSPDAGAGDEDDEDDTSMSFFVTSTGGPDGANFGGLAGADALCTTLAAAVSPELGAKTWAAYLSTSTVNARDRIGSGPWFNAAGVLVATDVDQLTDADALEATWATGDATIALDELGNQVPAGGGGGVQHDILTGTLADGTVATGLTCGDWTLTTGNVQIGHSNRQGGGDDPTSWSSAHGAPAGCAPPGAPAPNVTSGGGRGSIYCFEVN